MVRLADHTTTTAADALSGAEVARSPREERTAFAASWNRWDAVGDLWPREHR